MTDENSQLQVTQEQTVSGWHVGVIIIGIAITLPAFLVGAQIMGVLGAKQGALAILIGGAILALTASACMYVAVSERQTTYQLLDASFGLLGSRFVSFLIFLTLLGWFGVTVSLFGQAAAKSIEEIFSLNLPIGLYIIIGSLVMIITTIYGFQAIDILSKFTVPVMFLTLVVGVYFVSSNFSWQQIWNAPPNSQGMVNSFGHAISIVVGSFMVGVTIMPDISRFIKSKNQIYVASLGSFGFAFSLILIMAGLPGLMTGEKDLIISMYQSGLGIPALIMMIFASWTTNVSNLYSSTLGLSQVLPNVKTRTITVIAGTIGCLLALSGIMEHLVGFLIFLGIFIPPVAGIYMAHFFFGVEQSKSKISYPAILSWITASGTAYSTSLGMFVLTTIPAVDSLLTAVIIYAVISKGHAWKLRSQS